MVYREQAFRELVPVERCACNAPSTGPCEVCGRPWCDLHREGKLCIRCAHAIAPELEEHKPLRWYAAMTTEVIVTVGFLLAHTEIGVFLGAPLAVIVYFAVSRLQRRRVIARMAPRLAATTGEVVRPRPPPDVRDEPAAGFPGAP